MSSPDQRTDSILRQPVIGKHVRRLPGLMTPSAHRSPSEEAENNASNTRAVLREQFAAELSALKDEARQQGIAAARQEAVAALRAAEEEQIRQLQQKEAVLRKAIQQEREQLMDLVTAVRAHHEKMIPELEPVVARLALIVVAKLLGQHQVSRPLVADLAIHAIEEYRLGTLVKIRVAAVDYACIQADEAASELLQCVHIDHDLEAGSCLIDYGSGELDASLATQWAVIQAMILQAASGAGRVVSA